MIIAYTIGHTENYLKALKENNGDVKKVGKTAGYPGGWIWRTIEEAKSFIASPDFLKVDWGDGKVRNPERFSVFKVRLENGWDDVSSMPGEDGVYNLLIDSVLFQ